MYIFWKLVPHALWSPNKAQDWVYLLHPGEGSGPFFKFMCIVEFAEVTDTLK